MQNTTPEVSLELFGNAYLFVLMIDEDDFFSHIFRAFPE